MGYRGNEITTVIFVLLGLAVIGVVAAVFRSGRLLGVW